MNKSSILFFIPSFACIGLLAFLNLLRGSEIDQNLTFILFFVLTCASIFIAAWLLNEENKRKASKERIAERKNEVVEENERIQKQWLNKKTDEMISTALQIKENEAKKIQQLSSSLENLVKWDSQVKSHKDIGQIESEILDLISDVRAQLEILQKKI